MQLYELTGHELKEQLDKKEVSCREITEAFINRIEQVEDQIKAFVTVTGELALQQARSYDEAEPAPGLGGIPYGLKDIICTRGIRTTASSRMLENFIPFYDASVAARLAEHKGVLLGKLNLDEFAMGSSTEQSAFYPTRNPWDLERVPGGSSGGSAAAVAAGEVAYALGTDSGGSLRQPAAFCGVVGLKPTYGRVSRWGVMAYASSFDQVGVISKDVRDCALVMNMLAGHDHRDSTSIDKEVPDYSSFLTPDIKGLRIAYPREYFQQGVDSEIIQQVMNALKHYEQLGAVIEEVSLPHSEYALPAYYLIAPAEASANMARFDGVRYGLRDEQADNVVDMFSQSRSAGLGEEVKRRIMLGTYALSSGYYDTYYLKALKVRRLIAEDFQRVFADFDLIVTPTTPTIAFGFGENSGDLIAQYKNDLLTVPINMAGLPGMSVPCGFVNGMPVGMQLVAQPFDEGTIFKAAYAFEQTTEYHRARPTLGVNING